MLNYDDPKWNDLNGAYKQPYNPVSALEKLEIGSAVEEAWDELWNELHHQGDIGLASYAAVPHLVRIALEKQNLDWNLYSLISTIELERHRKTNPAISKWLESSYFNSLKSLAEFAAKELIKTNDQLTARAILGFLALSKGLVKYGALISYFDESEVESYLEEYLSWKELYN